MIDATLVTVHGFWSGPGTWDRLCADWQADDELEGLCVRGFGYPSPKIPRLPLSWTRVPDLDDIAQMLAAEYATVLGSASSVAFVTHSQGGLILQRFLAWMASEGHARELARIRTVVMLACPNGGSQYLASLRRVLGYGRHPQAGDLEVLNRQVANTQRAVLARIVHATDVDDHQCRIPFHVYAAGSDAIVTAASAQAAFPGAGTLAGNHFTILDPAASGNRTAAVVKHHLLTDIAEGPPGSGEETGPAVHARPAGHARPGMILSGTQGVQVGGHNVQYNVFSSPPQASADTPAVDGTQVASPERVENPARRPVRDDKRVAQDEGDGFREQRASGVTRLDQLQALVTAQANTDAQDQDRIIEALGEELSATTVARAMTVANRTGAFPKGEITLHASTDPSIDLTFSWVYHMGDGRFSQPGGNFLGINAHVAVDPRGPKPVINEIWTTTEPAATVIGRITDKLQQRGCWSGPGTINWEQVFRDLHQAIVVSVASKRRDSTVEWQLHGGLYELHGRDWAITEAGIEYRPGSQLVLSEADFPEKAAYPGRTDPDATERWPPPPPPAGADLDEWQHVLWRGQFHFPVYRGPVLAQPGWRPCTSFPEPPLSDGGRATPRSH